MGFEEDPNYDYLRGLFKKIVEASSLQFDNVFDWSKPDELKHKTSKSTINIINVESFNKFRANLTKKRKKMKRKSKKRF